MRGSESGVLKELVVIEFVEALIGCLIATVPIILPLYSGDVPIPWPLL